MGFVGVCDSCEFVVVVVAVVDSRVIRIKRLWGPL